MTLDRLCQILERLPGVRALVVGDFFLDQYWVVDPALQETSLETGLRAHQVTGCRYSPGAAGTVTNNLCALGLRQVAVAGWVGDDGSGWQLRRELERRGASVQGLLTVPGRLTPVYTKPMFRLADGEREGERFDLRSRGPLPIAARILLSEMVRELAAGADSVSIMDQVEESGSAVVDAGLRQILAELAMAHPGSPFLADSRARIAEFRHLLLKPNRAEAARAIGLPMDDIEGLVNGLFRLSGRPAFLTLGDQGMAAFDGEQMLRLPAIPVSGPIDPVGAGDSASAALVAALAAGASALEAVQLALLAASVTVKKLGTTGTASPEEILDVARNHRDLVEHWEQRSHPV